ncbi:hypothetical protein V8E36_007850 [Tilletia maclaganii]
MATLRFSGALFSTSAYLRGASSSVYTRTSAQMLAAGLPSSSSSRPAFTQTLGSQRQQQQPQHRALSSSSSASASPPKQSQPSASAAISDWLDQNLDRRFRERRLLGGNEPHTTTSGRSILVNAGDVTRAFRQMNGALKRDDIRNELRRGERYEKPNQERRRKRSERHRRRFADLVRKKVQLVMALRNRGA